MQRRLANVGYSRIKLESTNETIRMQVKRTNAELEHTLNNQNSDLQRKTIELEDSAEQVAWLQAYADRPHNNEVAKEKSLRFHVQRALVAMTVIVQTFTTGCDSSSKQLTVLWAQQQGQKNAEAALLEEYKVGFSTHLSCSTVF